MLQATDADVKLWYSSHSYLETELDISFQLSSLETIGMKCQTLFSQKHNKNISRCCLPELKVSMAKVNHIQVLSEVNGATGEYHYCITNIYLETDMNRKTLQSYWIMKYSSRSNIDECIQQTILRCNYVPIIIFVSLIVVEKWKNVTRSLACKYRSRSDMDICLQGHTLSCEYELNIITAAKILVRKLTWAQNSTVTRQWNHCTKKYRPRSKMGDLNQHVMQRRNNLPAIILVSVLVVEKATRIWNSTELLDHAI